MNILIVEDNAADRRVLKKAFAASCEEDITLHEVENAEEALKFVSHQGDYTGSAGLDLILLDLNLPGTHGRDVLRKLKTDPGTKNIPVIILTSSTFHGDICESYKLNANCYINKPMRYGELLKLVKLICDFWIKEVRYCRL